MGTARLQAAIGRRIGGGGRVYARSYSSSPDPPCELVDYDPNTRPDPRGTPTDVLVDVYVVDIYGVDNVGQSFRADFFLGWSWSDSRLGNVVRRSELEQCRFPLDAVWNPELVLFNSDSVPQLPESVRVNEEGRVAYTQRFSGSLRSPFHLQDFPIDHQVLPASEASPQRQRFGSLSTSEPQKGSG